jgi:hypothetical protein
MRWRNLSWSDNDTQRNQDRIERSQENHRRPRLRVPAAIQITAKVETTIAPISID